MPEINAEGKYLHYKIKMTHSYIGTRHFVLFKLYSEILLNRIVQPGMTALSVSLVINHFPYNNI